MQREKNNNKHNDMHPYILWYLKPDTWYCDIVFKSLINPLITVIQLKLNQAKLVLCRRCYFLLRIADKIIPDMIQNITL